jgi:hypothetical protein
MAIAGEFMANYDLFRIYVDTGDMDVVSSSIEVLDWIKNAVINTIPKAKVNNEHKHHMRIKGLWDRDYAIMWDIIEHFCHDGWEPFAVEVGGWYFRKELE